MSTGAVLFARPYFRSCRTRVCREGACACAVDFHDPSTRWVEMCRSGMETTELEKIERHGMEQPTEDHRTLEQVEAGAKNAAFHSKTKRSKRARFAQEKSLEGHLVPDARERATVTTLSNCALQEAAVWRLMRKCVAHLFDAVGSFPLAEDASKWCDRRGGRTSLTLPEIGRLLLQVQQGTAMGRYLDGFKCEGVVAALQSMMRGDTKSHPDYLNLLQDTVVAINERIQREEVVRQINDDLNKLEHRVEIKMHHLEQKRKSTQEGRCSELVGRGGPEVNAESQLENPSWREVSFAIVMRLRKRHQDSKRKAATVANVARELQWQTAAKVAEIRGKDHDVARLPRTILHALRQWELNSLSRVPARQAASQTIGYLIKEHRLRRDAWRKSIKEHQRTQAALRVLYDNALAAWRSDSRRIIMEHFPEMFDRELADVDTDDDVAQGEEEHVGDVSGMLKVREWILDDTTKPILSRCRLLGRQVHEYQSILKEILADLRLARFLDTPSALLGDLHEVCSEASEVSGDLLNAEEVLQADKWRLAKMLGDGKKTAASERLRKNLATIGVKVEMEREVVEKTFGAGELLEGARAQLLGVMAERPSWEPPFEGAVAPTSVARAALMSGVEAARDITRTALSWQKIGKNMCAAVARLKADRDAFAKRSLGSQSMISKKSIQSSSPLKVTAFSSKKIAALEKRTAVKETEAESLSEELERALAESRSLEAQLAAFLETHTGDEIPAVVDGHNAHGANEDTDAVLSLPTSTFHATFLEDDSQEMFEARQRAEKAAARVQHQERLLRAAQKQLAELEKVLAEPHMMPHAKDPVALSEPLVPVDTTTPNTHGTVISVGRIHGLPPAQSLAESTAKISAKFPAGLPAELIAESPTELSRQFATDPPSEHQAAAAESSEWRAESTTVSPKEFATKHQTEAGEAPESRADSPSVSPKEFATKHQTEAGEAPESRAGAPTESLGELAKDQPSEHPAGPNEESRARSPGHSRAESLQRHHFDERVAGAAHGVEVLQALNEGVSSEKAPYNNTSLIDLEICPLRAAVERLAGASAQSPADTSQSTDAVSVDHASEVLWKTPSVLKFQGYEHNQQDENGDHEVPSSEVADAETRSDMSSRFPWSVPTCSAQVVLGSYSQQGAPVDADVKERILDVFAQRRGSSETPTSSRHPSRRCSFSKALLSELRPVRPTCGTWSLSGSADKATGQHWSAVRFQDHECWNAGFRPALWRHPDSQTDGQTPRSRRRWSRHVDGKEVKKRRRSARLTKRALHGKLLQLLLSLPSRYVGRDYVCRGRPWTKQSSVEEFHDRGIALTSSCPKVDAKCWQPWSQAPFIKAEAQEAEQLDREKILWLSGFLLPALPAVGSSLPLSRFWKMTRSSRKASVLRKSEGPPAPPAQLTCAGTPCAGHATPGPWVKWSARRGASNKVYWDENHLDVAVEPSPVRRDSLCVVGIGMRVDEQDPTQHLRIDDRNDALQAQSTDGSPFACTQTSTPYSSTDVSVAPEVAEDGEQRSHEESDAATLELMELSFCAPKRFCGGPVAGKRHGILVRQVRSPEAPVASFNLGDASLERPAVSRSLTPTPAGRCRSLLDCRVNGFPAVSSRSNNVDGSDSSAVCSALQPGRRHRRSVSLRQCKARTLHSCPSVGQDVERVSAAMVSVSLGSREQSTAVRRLSTVADTVQQISTATSQAVRTGTRLSDLEAHPESQEVIVRSCDIQPTRWSERDPDPAARQTPENFAPSRSPSASHWGRRASSEFTDRAASRVDPRAGTSLLHETPVTAGLEEMLDVDLTAFAELAGEYQNDFRGSSMEVWLSSLPETGLTHRRRGCSLGQSPTTSKRAVTTLATTRAHVKANRAVVRSGQGPLERCRTALAAPASRTSRTQTLSPLPVLRTGTCTATPPLMGALLSPHTGLSSSTSRCASAFSRRRRKCQ